LIPSRQLSLKPVDNSLSLSQQQQKQKKKKMLLLVLFVKKKNGEMRMCMLE